MAVSAALGGRERIRSPAGHACSFADTERRLAPVLARVPITRVYDATALDRLGLPVWGAVTPLARDLTVHAGKGLTAQAARLSAVMEAIERVCAEAVAPERIRRASYLTLRRKIVALDPERFDLPFETAYSPSAPCGWIAGHDLLAGEEAWVALDLVVSPAAEGICRGPETNGLAAGNTWVEATLHAICELIERDAAALRTFQRRFGEYDEVAPARLLTLDSLPAPACDWVARLREAGLMVSVQEITHDLGVPVFRAALADRAFPGAEGQTRVFEGLGADLDALHAVTRALTEAVQAHTSVLLGARDSFESGEQPVARSRFLHALMAPAVRVAFDPGPPAPDDLVARLEIVLGRLRAAGFAHCVIVALTRPELGIPVVRALVPGLAGPYGQSSRRPGVRLLRQLV